MNGARGRAPSRERRRSQDRGRRRSRTRSPPPPPPAAALSQANLRQLFASFDDVVVLVEVERLLQEHHPQERLSALKGLYVRYRRNDYHLGAVTRFTVNEADEPTLTVQNYEPEPPFKQLSAASVSGTNPLLEPAWSQGGQQELAALQACMAAQGRSLPLQQAAEAVVRRRAAIHWYERYSGEEDMAEFLPRLIREMRDAEEVARVLRRLERAPAPSPRERQRRRDSAERRQQRQGTPDRQQQRRASPERRRRDSPQRQRQPAPREQQRQQQQQEQRQQQEPQEQQRQRQAAMPAQHPPAVAVAQQLPLAALHPPPLAVPQLPPLAAPLPPPLAAPQPPPLAPQPAADGDLPLPPHLMHMAAPAGPAPFAAAAAAAAQQPPGAGPMHRVAPANAGGGAGAWAAASSMPPAAPAASAELQAARAAAARLARKASGGSSSIDEAAVAAAKRKRAPISWEPQPMQQGDAPLQPLDVPKLAAEAEAAPPKAKHQKVAAPDPKRSPSAPQSSKLKITVSNPRSRQSPALPDTGGHQPSLAAAHGVGRSRLAVEGEHGGKATDPAFPPGFGDGAAAFAAAPAPSRAAAFYGKSLTVSVQAPPGGADDEDEPFYGAPPRSGSLAGRFDSLSRPLLDEPGLHLAPAQMVFSVPPASLRGPAVAAGAVYPPAAHTSIPFAGMDRYDSAIDASMPGHTRSPQLAAAQLLQHEQHMQQQLQFGAYPPSPMQAMAMAGPFAGNGYSPQRVHMPDAPQQPYDDGRRYSGGDGMGGGGGSGGGRQVSVDRDGGGGGRGRGRGRELFWDPLYVWESETAAILQGHAGGMRVQDLHDRHPLPRVWPQSYGDLRTYLARRKQLYVVRPGVGRGADMVAPAKGARGFLDFKRGLLQALAEQRPRTSEREALEAVRPLLRGLRADLRDELDTSPSRFFTKYLGAEVALSRSGGSGPWLLELRPFAGAAQPEPLAPPFKAACHYWKRNASCPKGGQCPYVHCPPREFAEHKPQYQGHKATPK